MKPEDVFRAEKERAVTARNSQHARLLAEAKAAFDKLMAEGQAARKSGRPRKHPLPPLKTSSSRPPVKSAAPFIPELRPAPPALPNPVAAPAPVAKVEPRVAAKAAGVARPAAKSAPPKRSAPAAKRDVKSGKARHHDSSSARAAKKSSKPKAKSAKRR